MPRVKRAVHSKKRRKEILEQAKGYYGARRKRLRVAKEQVMHSGAYAYRDRRVADAVKLKKRAFRERERSFLVEGMQAVAVAVDAGPGLSTLFVSAVNGTEPVVRRAEAAGTSTVHVSDEVMAHLTSTVTPQGIVGVSPFVDDALPEVA